MSRIYATGTKCKGEIGGMGKLRKNFVEAIEDEAAVQTQGVRRPVPVGQSQQHVLAHAFYTLVAMLSSSTV
jgi:hypothetical protein